MSILQLLLGPGGFQDHCQFPLLFWRWYFLPYFVYGKYYMGYTVAKILNLLGLLTVQFLKVISPLWA